MNTENQNQLIKKYLANECSDQERSLLENWYMNEADKAPDLLDIPDYFLVQKEILNNLKSRQGRNKIALWKKLSVAATVFIGLTAGIYFYTNINQIAQLKTPKKVVAEKIAPGTNKAYLTLADGKRIELTDTSNGELAAQAGVKITKTKDGQLIYSSSADSKNDTQANLFNKIEAPVGGQYQLILPDGTKIWLNASTSLKYPVSFTGLNERKVELEGEAYFEVAHMTNKPFKVVTNKQTIEVLGTHFNVNCYADEPSTKTSLLEGSVKVFTQKTAQPVFIKPGQQALLVANQFKITDEDVEQAVAWKNGDFVFNGENLQSLMRQIARWYNVDVVYEHEAVNNTGFIGTISRKKKITEILNAIELNYNVKFKIEGRRVLVTP
ncbi:FecR family protein [Pedobacter arcticus]|uniref:FecR family protein n=1 Tax=Pedobacter arcticus TaxID=752140 RepID=UPI00031DE783|nr:FecR family protein [Pedobacter arcticus]